MDFFGNFKNANTGLSENLDHRVHTERTLPLSRVQYIWMEKLAQPGEGGVGRGVHAHPFHCITRELVVYAPDETAGSLPLFLLYFYVYSVTLTTPTNRHRHKQLPACLVS